MNCEFLVLVRVRTGQGVCDLYVCVRACVSAREPYLVEIGKGGDLIPERLHDELVFVQAGRVDLALALDDGGTESHALEIVVVQEAIVVNVCIGERERKKRKGTQR